MRSQISREFDASLSPFIEGIPAPLLARLHATAEAHVRAVLAGDAARDGDEDDADADAFDGGGDAFDEEGTEEQDNGAGGAAAGFDRSGAVVRTQGVESGTAGFDWSGAMVRTQGVDASAAAAAQAGSESGTATESRSAGFAARRRGRIASSEHIERQRLGARRPWGPFLRLCSRFMAPFTCALAVFTALHLTTLSALERAEGLLGAALGSALLAQEVAVLPRLARSVVMKVRRERDEAVLNTCDSLRWHKSTYVYNPPTPHTCLVRFP